MEIDPSKFAKVDETRAPINIVFIGHVDVGKSTICGILFFPITLIF
jgi:translation elongation factor EF-1alpha